LLTASRPDYGTPDCIRANTFHPADFPHDGACYIHAEDCGKPPQNRTAESRIVFARIHFILLIFHMTERVIYTRRIVENSLRAEPGTPDCIRTNTFHPADFPHDGACHIHA
jgi:hypothetical protein